MSQGFLSSLRSEVTRLARRAVKSEVATLQSNSATHRRHIAELRRRIDALDREVKLLRTAGPVPVRAPVGSNTDSSTPFRFQSRGLKTHRESLGISAAAYGRLVGVSAWSIYDWESGTSRPGASHLPAIATVRRLGKREALARLELLSK